MPPKPEDKNSNSLHNSKSQLRRDSLKSMTRMPKEPKDLDYDINIKINIKIHLNRKLVKYSMIKKP